MNDKLNLYPRMPKKVDKKDILHILYRRSVSPITHPLLIQLQKQTVDNWMKYLDEQNQKSEV